MISGEVMNSLILLGVAAMNAVTAVTAWRTHQSAKRAEEQIGKVEIATNSMKDAMVKSAGVEGFQKGVDSVAKVEVAIAKLPTGVVTVTPVAPTPLPGPAVVTATTPPEK